MNYAKLKKGPDLARIVADITGDGHLQIRKSRYLISFYSKHYQEIETVKKRFFDIFGVEGRIYVDERTSNRCKNSGRRYKLFFMSKQVALLLKEIGVPTGNKTNNPFSIPDWIFYGDSNLKSAYLRGLFDNEGSIFCDSKTRKRWQIGFRMVKNREILYSGIAFFNQIKWILSEFGVYSSPVRCYKLNTRKDGSESYDMLFRIEKSSFKDYHKHIGFDHPLKKRKLHVALGLKGEIPKDI